MNKSELTLIIKSEAARLGFDSCKIAKAEEIAFSNIEAYEKWLSHGYNASLSFMNRNKEKRYNPVKLVDNTISVIVVGLNYYHFIERNEEKPKIAAFAINNDYHTVIKNKLYQLLEIINEKGIAVNGRSFCDSAPVAERYWAEKSGIGWIGKNKNIIIPGKGSYYHLGSLLVDVELDYDNPVKEHCGNCNKCITACPGNALSVSFGLDCNKCISYLTIEKKGDFTDEESEICEKGGYFFGCDICQIVCPWNKFRTEQTLDLLSAIEKISNISLDNIDEINLKDTCLSRIDKKDLKRNFEALKKIRPELK